MSRDTLRLKVCLGHILSRSAWQSSASKLHQWPCLALCEAGTIDCLLVRGEGFEPPTPPRRVKAPADLYLELVKQQAKYFLNLNFFNTNSSHKEVTKSVNVY